MLQELLGITDTVDFEENGGVSVISAAWQNDNEDLELTIEVNTGQEEIQSWVLLCRSEREHNIVLGWGDCLEVATGHVLLWPHNQNICSLWFRGSGRNALAVIGDLWREHQDSVGSWFPFHHFLNSSDFVGLVEGGHGQLAKGPEQLINVYRQVLQKHGFKTSITSCPPLRWNGEAWVDPGTVVVILAGRSRAIASSVEARRTD